MPLRRTGFSRVFSLLVLFVVVAITGCSTTQSPSGENRIAPVPESLAAPPPGARIEPILHRSPAERPDGGVAVAATEEPEQTPHLFSRKQEQLNREVASFCERARAAGDKRGLTTLVADLGFSGIDPATATEALLRGNCGAPAEVIAELIARGGEQAIEPVSDRAQSVLGPKQRKRIDAAAKAGLARYVGGAGAAEDAATAADPLPAYGMLYLPSVGEGGRIDTSMALNRLYDEAVPGFGLYTFVLLGRGYGTATEAVAARYREFFRVIETYVSVVTNGQDDPAAEAHAFLIPIHPGEADTPLADQIATDLSDFMRLNLCRHLRRQGQPALAMRIEKGAGPFLVTTEEPTLMPSSKSAPRLIADLSGLGPEDIYGIADAYDRPVPTNVGGRTKGLEQIRDRLRALPVNPGSDSASPSSTEKSRNTWIISLGKFAATQRARTPPTRPTPSNRALPFSPDSSHSVES